MASLFVSHSSQDAGKTAELVRWLRAEGFDALFVDFDPECGIPGGRNWERELYAQLRRADGVVYVASPASAASRWCFAELSLARSIGKPILPVLVAGTERVTLLTDVQWVDVRSDSEAGLHRVLQGLHSAGIDARDAFGWDANRSLAKEAADRPPDFADLLERIRRIVEDYDLVDLLRRTVEASDLYGVLRERASALLGWRHTRIRDLLSLEEAAQALEELESIPPIEYDAELWGLRGSALSLLNRPEEALEALERGLAGELAPVQRVNALSEYALVLKRLGRFDEARELYQHLMTEVPDDQLSVVVVNLASVFLQQEDGEHARQLLEPFVRKTPEKTPGVPEAWVNLGQSYAMVGRYDDAVAAFGKALALAPQNGAFRVRLAAVYMDHLGWLDEAWAALDAAFDSGHESREWFVRMLACSLLLDRKEVIDGMLHAARNNFPDELGRALVAESVDMARELAEKYANESVVEPDTNRSTSDGQTTCDDTAEEAVPSDPDARVPGIRVPSHASTVADAAVRPDLPFLNVRLYSGLFDFTIDYYESIEAADFVRNFLVDWRRATRDPRLTGGSGATLRGSAFYFTLCPGCGITVLTNRDVGKRIDCRMCRTGWHTSPVHGPVFDRIVAEVSAELGIEEATEADGPDVHVLFVQTRDDDTSDVVGEVCRQAGMVELAPNLLMSVHMLHKAMSRGLARPQRSWSVWEMTSSESETWARDSTPRAISAVVRELQHRAPEVTTLSTTLSATKRASWDKTLKEAGQELEGAPREAVRSGEAQADDLRQLASLLDDRGEYGEAERTARAAIAADQSSAEGWEILGRALFGQEDFAGARDALEESLARDPTSLLVLTRLARCYEMLGESRRAHELHMRAIGHGKIF